MATIRLRNSRLGSIVYGLEPWGEAYDLRPDATLTLNSEGFDSEYLEIVLEDDRRITSWSATGSTVTLFEGDRELESGFAPRIPVPNYPPSVERPRPPLYQSAAYWVELVLLNWSVGSLALWTPSQSEPYILPSGSKCAIVATGMNSGPMELELAEDTVTAHGWPACQFAVLEESHWRATQ